MSSGARYGMNFSGQDGNFSAPYGDGYGIHQVWIMVIIVIFAFNLLTIKLSAVYVDLFSQNHLLQIQSASDGPLFGSGSGPASWEKSRMNRR